MSHPSEKYECQLGWWFPTEWENNPNVPNHQPDEFSVMDTIGNGYFQWESYDEELWLNIWLNPVWWIWARDLSKSRKIRRYFLKEMMVDFCHNSGKHWSVHKSWVYQHLGVNQPLEQWSKHVQGCYPFYTSLLDLLWSSSYQGSREGSKPNSNYQANTIAAYCCIIRPYGYVCNIFNEI